MVEFFKTGRQYVISYRSGLYYFTDRILAEKFFIALKAKVMK